MIRIGLVGQVCAVAAEQATHSASSIQRMAPS
jgi:hypothetical protein